jgi:predicted TIM-barrel enzyme
LATETRDLTERGLADGIIVSGEMTGEETKPSDVEVVRQHTDLPILIGSGVTPENVHRVYEKADGFIVGSYFKKDGKGENFIEKRRVRRFMEKIKKLDR